MSTMKRKALGRGLKSLIRDAPKATTAMDRPRPSGLLQLDLDRIRPNRSQPRKAFDEEALEELALSMAREGVLQPVIVRPTDDGQYELIAGERRWRAAQRAGLLKIPALVREVEDDRRLELALIENIQREDLNPIESAMAFQTLIEELELTQQEVADRVGKQRATVTNMLRLLTLPQAVQDLVSRGRVSLGHAKVLAGLSNRRAQTKLAERIAKGGLSVRQLERMVTAETREATTAVVRVDRPDPNIRDAEQRLQKALGTKVAITQGKDGGKIELHFFSSEELERVYQLILKAAQSSQN